MKIQRNHLNHCTSNIQLIGIRQDILHLITNGCTLYMYNEHACFKSGLKLSYFDSRSVIANYSIRNVEEKNLNSSEKINTPRPKHN